MKVEPKPWLEYFRLNSAVDEEPSIWVGSSRQFYRADVYRRSINLFTICCAMLLAFGALSYFSRVCLVFFVTILTMMTFLYFQARALANGLTIRRLIPTKTVHENDRVTVTIEVLNYSEFALSGLVVSDRFDAAQDYQVAIVVETLERRSMRRVTYEKKLDGGMGVKNVGPLKAIVSDPLGIFEFRVQEESATEIEVFPFVEEIPKVPVRPSIETNHYGIYEVSARGSNVCLAGIWPYDSGDSPRHIAWKLSTRGQGLLVKEFEKSVNSGVCVILNLSPRWQIGKGARSSWEFLKDVTLSIVEQQLELGNTVSLFTGDMFVPAGSGNEHYHRVARAVASLKIQADAAVADDQDLVFKYLSLIPRGSHVFYISSFHKEEHRQSRIGLKRLRTTGFGLSIVYADTMMFFAEHGKSIEIAPWMDASFLGGLKEAAYEFRAFGVDVYVADPKFKVSRAFIPNALNPSQGSPR